MKHRLIVLLLVLVFGVAACGDDDGGPENDPHDDTWVDATEVPVGEDITFFDATHDGVTYRCLYIYADGYNAGGPAMWCERTVG